MRDRSKLTSRRSDEAGARIEALESRRLLAGSPFSGPLQAAPGAPLEGVAGEEVSGFLAKLSGVNDVSQFADPLDRPMPRYRIRWGDGTVSYEVTGLAGSDSLGAAAGHTYRKAGDYVIHGAFDWQGRVLARVQQVARVSQNSSNGLTLYAVAGEPVSDVVLGTISTEPGWSTYNPVVFWGDRAPLSHPAHLPAYPPPAWGSNSPATLQPVSPSLQLPGDTVYQAIGTHTYKRAGEYRVRVAVGSHAPPGVGISDTWGPAVFSTVIVTKPVKSHAASL